MQGDLQFGEIEWINVSQDGMYERMIFDYDRLFSRPHLIDFDCILCAIILQILGTNYLIRV